MELKTIIKSRREALGLTPTELAKKIGVSLATVSRWESGIAKSIKQDKLEKVAEVLQVDIVDLIQKPEPQTKPTVNGDPELTEYLEYLRDREELRLLFKVSKNATKADVERAVKIIESLTGYKYEE